MAVRCSSVCEDHSRVAVHPDVESRGFKRLRRTQCDGGSGSELARIEEGGFSASKS